MNVRIYFLVDAGWSEWTSWNCNAVTCGSGNKTRSRQCNNTLPSGGGKTCSGVSSETHPCAIGCPNRCTMDVDTCGYNITGRWRLNSGKTPSTFTGPSTDVSGKIWNYLLRKVPNNQYWVIVL